MQGVQQTIAALDTLFTDSLQRARLDTLSTLLAGKQENMRRLVQALESNAAPQIYQHQIGQLVKSHDTVVHKPHVTRQVIRQDQTYKIKEPKRNFFQRLASAFHKPEVDTAEVRQTVQILETDTLQQAFNVRDTLAHLLDSVERSMEQYSTQRRRRINAQAERLWYTSLELNNRVTQLLESIDREEQELLEADSSYAYHARTRAAMTTGIIAASAILLAIVFFVIVWRDITKSNHYRRELEKAKQKAEDLLVSREKLMLTVTHDIKAPVGSIMGYTELLAPYVTESRSLNYLDNIRSSSEHLLRLVGSLLDYHKLEAHKMDLQSVSFCPDALLHTIAQSFLPLAEKKGLALACETTPETRKNYGGDAFRIRQIVENLVSNALKFTREGRILLRAKMHGRLLCITVQDTGCGMNKEEQQLIFKEFTRLSSAQGEEGVGLGLSITLKLVQLLQGELSVDSTPGQGSTFFITLPLQPAREEGDTARQERRDTDLPVRPLRILLIDDDPLQLQLTQTLLQQITPPGVSWEIVACRQPDEVFQSLEKGRFDVLLTDIQMPAMNGFELLKNLQKKGFQKKGSLPVVAITARSDMQEADFQKYGFATCLYKPFNRHDLEQAIGKVFGSKPLSGTSQDGIPTNCPAPSSGITFEPLVAFAGGDPEAVREILHTFGQETRQNAEAFARACREKDKAGACRLAHKVLPTFSMVNAPCISALQQLERQRGEGGWQSSDDALAKEISEAFGLVLHALEENGL